MTALTSHASRDRCRKVILVYIFVVLRVHALSLFLSVDAIITLIALRIVPFKKAFNTLAVPIDYVSSPFLASYVYPRVATETENTGV